MGKCPYKFPEAKAGVLPQMPVCPGIQQPRGLCMGGNPSSCPQVPPATSLSGCQGPLGVEKLRAGRKEGTGLCYMLMGGEGHVGDQALALFQNARVFRNARPTVSSPDLAWKLKPLCVTTSTSCCQTRGLSPTPPSPTLHPPPRGGCTLGASGHFSFSAPLRLGLPAPPCSGSPPAGTAATPSETLPSCPLLLRPTPQTAGFE